MAKLLLIIGLLLSSFAQAVQELALETADGDEITIEQHPAEGERLLLWLPSEFGLSPRQQPTAQALAARGIEVWIPDLHGAWFIPPGRYSLNDVSPGTIQSLIEMALATGKQVSLFASGRVNALALYAVRRLQQTEQDTSRLQGLIAISPRLYRRTPNGTEAAEYLPITTASNLPLFLMQPRAAGSFWRVKDLVAQLEQGGSPVFLQVLPDAGDGFHTRPEFSEAEGKLTERLPSMLDQALKLMALQNGTPSQPAPMQGEEIAPERITGSALLNPVAEPRPAPALRLPMLSGSKVDLQRLAGKVVLVNFWATWCPPCVEEIPSLERLYQRYQDQGLEILAVDVGEAIPEVKKFLADKPVKFPVLLDTQGEALKRWNVHAFPTTLILDRELKIRYAVFGAFNWDSSEVHQALEPLLQGN